MVSWYLRMSDAAMSHSSIHDLELIGRHAFVDIVFIVLATDFALDDVRFLNIQMGSPDDDEVARICRAIARKCGASVTNLVWSATASMLRGSAQPGASVLKHRAALHDKTPAILDLFLEQHLKMTHTWASTTAIEISRWEIGAMVATQGIFQLTNTRASLDMLEMCPHTWKLLGVLLDANSGSDYRVRAPPMSGVGVDAPDVIDYESHLLGSFVGLRAVFSTPSSKNPTGKCHVTTFPS
ncbi:hypothetical protein C8J56DRAFT_1139378 [Mycena floridula]|nr:hypothetical protein C8J56DRAFT_1139378 [Mycena floridula]